MTISIITVVRNNRPGLARTIASLRTQTYRDFEFIVIDGASDDGTVAVIRSHEDLVDYWESRPDQGIYDAMNKGLARASGAFTLFLNAGDELLDSNSLAIAAQAAAQHPDADVLYFQAIRDSGRRASRFERARALLFDSVGNHQAVLVRTPVHQRFAFDTRYRIKADRDAQLRMYLSGCLMQFVPQVIARCESGGVSSTRIVAKELENLQICWRNRVGLPWTAIAICLATARVSLYGLARLTGIDWERLKGGGAPMRRLSTG